MYFKLLYVEKCQDEEDKANNFFLELIIAELTDDFFVFLQNSLNQTDNFLSLK